MNTVVLVDDERVNSNLIKMLLELDGFTVHSCPTLAQARAVMSAETDALIIDCNLAQGVDGLELLRAIRRGETAVAPDTVVIAMSGDDRREQEALEARADQFLLKPFSPSDLSADLKRLITAKYAPE